MPSPSDTERQINDLIAYLVKISLADDQCFAFQRTAGDKLTQVTFVGSEHVTIALRDQPYDEIYRRLEQERAYNVKMLDGALVQMMYLFAGETLQRHRLAFFPAPHLDEFQNNPEIYRDDEMYAEVVARNIVPFPIRFDYDMQERLQAFTHPKCHLTLGQYQNCRIPVNAPVMPFRFIDFVLRNFYHTVYDRQADALPTWADSFAETIRSAERDVVHVVVPA